MCRSVALLAKARRGFIVGESRAVSITYVSLAAILAAILNLLIQSLLAARFGAGRALDAYFAALVVPTVLSDVLIASLVNVFLPMFVEQRIQGGESPAWRTVSTPVNVLMVVLIAICAAGMVGAGPIIHVIAPGLDEETAGLAVQLLRMLFPFVVASGVFSLLISVLNSYGRFFFSSVGRILRWAVTLGGMWIFTACWGILGVTVSVLLGLIVASTVLWLGIPERRYYSAVLQLDQPVQRGILRLWGTLLLASSLYKLYPVIDRAFASELGVGSISYLSYAMVFLPLFSGVFSGSIATVFFPDVARSVAGHDVRGLLEQMSLSIRMSGFIMVPSIVGLIALRRPITRLLFERGAFTAQDSQATAIILVFTVGILFAPILADTTSKVLFSMKATSFLLLLSVVLVPLYTITCGILSRFLGVRGIALTGSIWANLAWVLHLVYIGRKLGRLQLRSMVAAFGRILACAVPMGFLTHYAYQSLRAAIPTGSVLVEALLIGCSIVMGMIIFGALAVALRVEEVALFRARVAAWRWRK